MLLPSVLHLYDDVLSCVGLAEDIIYNLPHLHLFRLSLVVQVSHIGYHMLSLQQTVQKIYQELSFLPKICLNPQSVEGSMNLPMFSCIHFRLDKIVDDHFYKINGIFRKIHPCGAF